MGFAGSQVGRKRKFDRRVWDEKSGTRFIGVGKTDSGRFDCKITDPFKKKTIWVGTFDTPEEASKAYLAKKREFEDPKGFQWEEEIVFTEHDHDESEKSDDHPAQEYSPMPERKDDPDPDPDPTHEGHSSTPPESSRDENVASDQSSTDHDEPLDSSSQTHNETSESCRKPLPPTKVPVQIVSVKSRNFQGGGATGFLAQNPNSCSGKNPKSKNLFLPVVDNYGFLLGQFSKLDDLSILDDWQ